MASREQPAFGQPRRPAPSGQRRLKTTNAADRGPGVTRTRWPPPVPTDFRSCEYSTTSAVSPDYGSLSPVPSVLPLAELKQPAKSFWMKMPSDPSIAPWSRRLLMAEPRLVDPSTNGKPSVVYSLTNVPKFLVAGEPKSALAAHSIGPAACAAAASPQRNAEKTTDDLTANFIATASLGRVPETASS